MYDSDLWISDQAGNRSYDFCKKSLKMIMKGMTTIIQCLYKQIYVEYDKIDF